MLEAVAQCSLSGVPSYTVCEGCAAEATHISLVLELIQLTVAPRATRISEGEKLVPLNVTVALTGKLEVAVGEAEGVVGVGVGVMTSVEGDMFCQKRNPPTSRTTTTRATKKLFISITCSF